MERPQDGSMEEKVWRSPQHVQMMGGYLHSNNKSEFFDATSNNASLAIQASYNDSFRHFVETREAFEGHLKTMQGVEFMVIHDPLQAAAQSDTSFAHEPSNIWVIRKQTRRKRSGMEDDVVALATYYVVGDCIYMAPSISRVIGNRILSATTSLTTLLNIAAPLSTFTPSHGYTYATPATKPSDPSSQLVSQTQQSKENTPIPEMPTRTTKGPTVGTTIEASEFQDLWTLEEAFRRLTRYGDEYMDEHPLVGEPGSFILSKSSDASSSRQIPKTNLPRSTQLVQIKAPRSADAPSSDGKLPTPIQPPDGREKLKRRKSKTDSVT